MLTIVRTVHNRIEEEQCTLLVSEIGFFDCVDVSHE